MFDVRRTWKEQNGLIHRFHRFSQIINEVEVLVICGNPRNLWITFVPSIPFMNNKLPTVKMLCEFNLAQREYSGQHGSCEQSDLYNFTRPPRAPPS